MTVNAGKSVLPIHVHVHVCVLIFNTQEVALEWLMFTFQQLPPSTAYSGVAVMVVLSSDRCYVGVHAPWIVGGWRC